MERRAWPSNVSTRNCSRANPNQPPQLSSSTSYNGRYAIVHIEQTRHQRGVTRHLELLGKEIWTLYWYFIELIIHLMCRTTPTSPTASSKMKPPSFAVTSMLLGNNHTKHERASPPDQTPMIVCHYIGCFEQLRQASQHQA